MALKTYLTGIADAIREKKGTTDPINAQDFASEISSISTGGGEDYLQILVKGKGEFGADHLCANFQGTNIDFITSVDFSNMTAFNYMFQYCRNLTAIPQINTSSATNMQSMFYGCDKLTTLPQLNTNNVTNMKAICQLCQNLTTVAFNTDKVTALNTAFSGCFRVTTIDLTSMDLITSSTSSSSMCSQCYSLKNFIIRNMTRVPTIPSSTAFNAIFDDCYHFTGTVHERYNPEGLQDGRIYVPDAMVDTLKAATNWSTFADIIVPLSTLVED